LNAQTEPYDHDSKDPILEICSLRHQITQLQSELASIKLAFSRELELLRAVDKKRQLSNEQETAKRFFHGSYDRKTLADFQGGVYCLQVSGNVLICGSGDKTVRLYDLNTGECIKTLLGHTAGISCLQYEPSSNLLVTGSWDKSIRVWDVQTGEHQVFQAHMNGVRCLQFYGSTLVSGASDKIVFIWNMNEGQCEFILKGHEGTVYCLQFDPQTNRLVTGSADKTVRIWNMKNGKCTGLLTGHRGDVYCLKLLKSHLITGSADATLRLWDLDSGECLRIMVHTDAVYACSISEDGQVIASGCADSAIRVWDWRSGEMQRILKLHSDGIYALQIDNHLVVSASLDKTVCISNFAIP